MTLVAAKLDDLHGTGVDIPWSSENPGWFPAKSQIKEGKKLRWKKGLDSVDQLDISRLKWVEMALPPHKSAVDCTGMQSGKVQPKSIDLILQCNYSTVHPCGCFGTLANCWFPH